MRYNCFIGRWVTFHKGHLFIIREAWRKNQKPILILIMDTEEEPKAEDRLQVISEELLKTKIHFRIMIIPPICSLNYGRDVGYEINYIDAPDVIKKLSGSKIRKFILLEEKRILEGYSDIKETPKGIF